MNVIYGVITKIEPFVDRYNDGFGKDAIEIEFKLFGDEFQSLGISGAILYGEVSRIQIHWHSDYPHKSEVVSVKGLKVNDLITFNYQRPWRYC